MSFYSKTLHLSRLLLVKGAEFGLGFWVTIVFTALPVQAMFDAHQQGMSLARDIPLPQPGAPENVPGYAGTNLPQIQIKAHDLGEEALKASQNSEAAQLISEGFEKGERFVIDPHTDPLIVTGNEIISNPQKTLDERFVEEEEDEAITEEIKTCEEGGDEYVQKCSKRLEIVLKVIPEQGYTTPCNNPWCAFFHHHSHHHWGLNWGLRKCNGGQYVRTQAKKVETLREEWVDGCAVLEDLSEKGLCRYVEKTTGPQNETRTIDGEPITRDHFEEYLQYACVKASHKSCAGLREKGCYQVKSVCKEEIDGRCVLWEQTYRCPSKKVFGKSYRSSNKENPFCLSGDCFDKSYAQNQDFANVMSRMSVLKEAGDDLRSFGAIFKGVDRRCTRHCVGFKDCCGNGNGWGVSIKLASCDADEKELAELRKKNRCVQVGTYCAEKVLGVCVRKKTSFCCYGTKLAKIVQEQGKRQLGLGFGSPKHPECQGLTAEQLSRLDFSRIDFSDVFSEVVGRTRTPNPEKIVSGIQKSMENKGSLLKPLAKGMERPLSIQSPQAGNEPLAKNTHNSGNVEIQGRYHGQF